MTRKRFAPTHFLASVLRRLSGSGSPPDGPPPGWERRELHFPDGEILVFDAPIERLAFPARVFPDFGSATEATRRDGDRRLRSPFVPGSPKGFVPDRPAGRQRKPGRPPSGECPLLNEFLERRAGW